MHSMAERKVLVIVGDANETVDMLYPCFRLIEGGYRPVVAAPEKRRYRLVMHEVNPGWTITKEWEGYLIEAEITFKDIRPEKYAGIFFSGGRAMVYLRKEKHLLRITAFTWTNLASSTGTWSVATPTPTAAASRARGAKCWTLKWFRDEIETSEGTPAVTTI